MRDFLQKSVPSLLLILTLAGVGYLTLKAPAAPAPLPAAWAIASHTDDCPLCRLPLYGKGAESSKLGPDPLASVDAAAATHLETTLK
jgi:hypothetical protein